MDKKGVYFVVGLLVIFSLTNVYAAVATETGDTITVIINGYLMTLQQAIDNDAFSNAPSDDLSSELSVGHSAQEVWISVGGSEDMLQNKINLGPNGLCVAGGGASTTIYSGGVHIGHFGDSVNVKDRNNQEMTLQALIDGGGTCCISEEQSVTCSGLCGPQTNNCDETVQCDPCETCSDGIQNQDETGVDCGGVCNACPTRTVIIRNQPTCRYVTYGWGRDSYRVWECGNSNGWWDGGDSSSPTGDPEGGSMDNDASNAATDAALGQGGLNDGSDSAGDGGDGGY